MEYEIFKVRLAIGQQGNTSYIMRIETLCFVVYLIVFTVTILYHKVYSVQGKETDSIAESGIQERPKEALLR